MAWFEKLQEATIGGIPFKVEAANGQSTPGWRSHKLLDSTIEHEAIPDNVESLSFTGYLIGDDAEEQFKALSATLNNKTVALTLQHPFLGRFKVIPKPYSFSTSQKGRIISISLSFEIADRVNDPKPATAKSTPDETIEEQKLKVLNDIDKWLASAYKTVNAYLEEVREARRTAQRITDTLARVKKLTNLGNEFIREINNIKGTIISDLAYINAIGNDIRNVLTWATNPLSREDVVPANARTSNVGYYLNLSNTQFSESDLGTPSEVLNRYVEQICVTLAATSLAGARYDSREELTSSRDEVLARLTSVIEDPNTDIDTASSMLALYRVVSYSLDEGTLSDTIAEEISVTPSESIAKVTYSYYNDISRMEEIVRNNRINDPVFMDDVDTLEVYLA